MVPKVKHNTNPMMVNNPNVTHPPVNGNMMNNRLMFFTGTLVTISIIIGILYSQGIIGSPSPSSPNDSSASNGTSMTFAPSSTAPANNPVTTSTIPSTTPSTEPVAPVEPVEPIPSKGSKTNIGVNTALKDDIPMMNTATTSTNETPVKDPLKYTEYKKNNHGLVQAYIINGTGTNKVNGLHNGITPVTDNVPVVCAKLCNDNIECNRISYKPNGTSCFFWQGGESATPSNTPFNLYVKP